MGRSDGYGNGVEKYEIRMKWVVKVRGADHGKGRDKGGLGEGGEEKRLGMGGKG